MVRYRNECCDCAAPGYPCRGSSCELQHVEVFYCDECREEIEGEPYELDGADLCYSCYEDLKEEDEEDDKEL